MVALWLAVPSTRIGSGKLQWMPMNGSGDERGEYSRPKSSKKSQGIMKRLVMLRWLL
jgi:hypothetical protein